MISAQYYDGDLQDYSSAFPCVFHLGVARSSKRLVHVYTFVAAMAVATACDMLLPVVQVRPSRLTCVMGCHMQVWHSISPSGKLELLSKSLVLPDST